MDRTSPTTLESRLSNRSPWPMDLGVSGQRFLLVAVFLSLGVGACASEDPARRGADGGVAVTDAAMSDGGAFQEDSGAIPHQDASAPQDASSDALNPGVVDPDLNLAGGGAREGDDYGSCYDSLDNDGSGAFDCADARCGGLRSCCVDSARCLAPSESLFERVYATCDDCQEGFLPFGSPAPSVHEGALALAGDAAYDSGLIFETPVDLRTGHGEVSVRFQHAPCTEGCLESAAIGWTTEVTMGDHSHVRPVAALRLVGPTEEVQLLVGERVAATLPLGDQAVPWLLDLWPDGRVVARHDALRVETVFVPPAEARAVMFGHSENPDATFEEGVRIAEASVRVSQTDRANAWRQLRHSAVVGERLAAMSLPDGRDLVMVEGAEGLAFFEGAAGPIEEAGGAEDEFLAPSNWMFQVPPPEGSQDFFFYADPPDHVARTCTVAETRVWCASMDFDARTIGTFALFFAPSDLGWFDTHEATVVAVNSLDVVVMRVGGHLRAAYRRGARWLESPGLAEHTIGAREPSLLVHDGVYLLHFTEQRGSRRQIHALVSDQMRFWRSLGTVHRGSGLSRFDRFSVSAPALVVQGERLRLYFLGDDHIATRVGVTDRISPMGRMP